MTQSTAIEVLRQDSDALDEIPPLEPWQVQEVLQTCAELDEDPTQVITMEELKAHLDAEYAHLLKAS